jgi:hypothetical protein
MHDAKPHASKSNIAKMEAFHLKRTAHSPFSPDIAPSDFFLIGWLRSEPGSRPVAQIDDCFEIVKAILGTLTIEHLPAFLKLDRKTKINECYRW